MIENSESLVAQVFKARYFKNCDIMEANLGNNPSFVWRSLCWGTELLNKGLAWIIANGNDINANTRNWFAEWALASNSTCRVRGLKVAAYINNNGEWREEAIRRDFLAYEANDILNKRIVKEEGVDRRYWRFHPKGIYTVSSGYRLGTRIKHEVSMRNLPECSKDVTQW